MSGKNLALIVVIVNLILFGIIELLSLSSMEIMTPARILTHIGFIVNILLLVVVVMVMGKSRG